MRIVSLAIALFVFWILLSGHFDPFLLGAGILASIGIAVLGIRLGFADEEGHPAELIIPGAFYWPWLLKEIAKSAIGVSRAILGRRLDISPRVLPVTVSQKTAVGVVTYANSITLTPGTITVDVDRRDRRLIVHALTKSTADDLLAGEMDRRVSAFEGKR